MADEAALWGDPTTLCTLEELRSARAALQSYDDVLRTPLLPCWPVGAARISLKLESLQTTGLAKPGPNPSPNRHPSPNPNANANPHPHPPPHPHANAVPNPVPNPTANQLLQDTRHALQAARL